MNLGRNALRKALTNFEMDYIIDYTEQRRTAILSNSVTMASISPPGRKTLFFAFIGWNPFHASLKPGAGFHEHFKDGDQSFL